MLANRYSLSKCNQSKKFVIENIVKKIYKTFTKCQCLSNISVQMIANRYLKMKTLSTFDHCHDSNYAIFFLEIKESIVVEKIKFTHQSFVSWNVGELGF